MSRILGVSRVIIENECRIRFLCIQDSVDTYKASLIMSNVAYPCYSIYEIASMLDINDLFCIEYPLKDMNTLGIIPIVHVSLPLRICRLKNEDKVIELLNQYNPFILNTKATCFLPDLSYYNSGWITYRGVLLCMWKPAFRDSSIAEHIRVQDGVLYYSFEKDVYILTNENVRHRPAKLGEVMSVNLDSLECVRYIRKIDRSNNYIESMQVFDKALREWVTVRSSEPVVVLGRRDR